MEKLLPTVSVIIANYNGGRFIRDALASCLRQTLSDIEIIVIDDASTDDSVDQVRFLAPQDRRVQLIEMPRQMGPGHARNMGLAKARGSWLAVLDSDDIMHPERLAQLVEAATVAGVEIVADNQLVFDDTRGTPARTLLSERNLPVDGRIAVEDYIDSNRLFSGSTPLGYLKPLILRSFLEQAECRYDPSLQIGEDYDLILRLLLRGARFHVCPQMTYFYRRHSLSISHRLSMATLLPMLAADDAVRTSTAISHDPSLRTARLALDRRSKSIERAIGFDILVQDLQARRWSAALRLCLQQPRSAALLRIPLQDRIRRIKRPKQPDRIPPVPRVSLLSRQRVVGATNGSSAYLIGICSTLKRAGYQVDLISPSPAMFGRWPFLRLDAAMDVFDSIHIRHSLRVGRFVIAKDPRIACRAAAGVLQVLLNRLHLGSYGIARTAPHAIAAPLTDADRLFIANVARPSTVILADYAFLNDAVPFALQPRAASAVVMHDLFFAQDPTRAIVLLDRDAEMTLLDKADAVIAIQAEEGREVRKSLPDKHVILAPMAVSSVSEAARGEDGSILFVGSNTLPNIDGINWFLANVWPELLRRHPAAQLRIAGSCCRGLSNLPPNVTPLGQVESLDGPYRQAGIVISPLRLGSGLKIKLVEAFGHGKAIVATETTLQGIHDVAGHAVVQANTAVEFIEALARLLYDETARSGLGSEALAVARLHFSTTACYRDLLDFIHHAERA